MVYRALDRTLGRPVALKLIQQPPGTDQLRDDFRRRFRREAGTAARISPHPNVVRIYDYGTDAELDLDFIVMELLQGRDLADLIRLAPPAPAEAVSILLQAALGIAAGHRAGILHRDIKPGNVFLVEGDGGVRVLDFGIAKVLEVEGEEDLTLVGLLPHSPAYASPEQLDPSIPLTPASDVYQLGLLAYETLAGVKPYAPAEREAITRGERVPLPERGRWSETPGALRRVVERSLARDPRNRYPDAAAFALALAEAGRAAGVLSDTVVSSVPPALDRPDVRAEVRDGEDVTLAAGPYGASAEETLFAPEPGASGPGGRLQAEDQTLYAPDHPRYGAEVEGVAAPQAEAPGIGRRRGRLFVPGDLLRAAAALLVVAAVIWGLTALQGEDQPVPDPDLLEVEEEFRTLQSEAARQLERTGEWER